MVKKPWIVVHSPVSIEDVIFSDERIAATFKGYVAEGNFPNLLLCGRPGTGKTSVSKALCRDLDVDAIDILRINCSDEKIDAMRDKVKGFAHTYPVSKYKVIQLEEFDHLSIDAQALLRALIDEAPSSCRFIATCNYINKVIPPLRSRFQEFQFNAPDVNQVAIRCAEILEKQKVQFEVEDLEKVINVAYPDFRKIIHLLEQNSQSGSLVIASSEGAADWKFEIFPLLDACDFKSIRKLVCEKASKEELQDIYKFLYEHLSRCKKIKAQDEAIVKIAEYAYRHSFVADPEINVAALMIELSMLVE